MAYLSKEEREILEERTGLDVLRQFIPDNCYNDSLIKHVARDSAELESEHTRNSVRESSVQKAAAIMTYLRDNGYNYTVEPDRGEGQLRLRLDGSKMQIRIMDTDKNAQYVGRVHNDGLTYSYSSKVQNVTPIVTSDMAVNLVKYAMGESIERTAHKAGVVAPNQNVGLLGSSFEKNNKTGKVTVKPDTYITANPGARHFTTKAVDSATCIRKATSGIDFNVNNDAYIYVTNNRVSSDIKFRNEETALFDAETFIDNARESAVTNFTAALKLDAVDELAKLKTANTFDGLPAFSSESNFISEMQQKYYQDRLDIYSNKDDKYNTDILREDALYAHDLEFKKTIQENFGNSQDRSINPIPVSMYMTSGKGSIANEADLLSALKTANAHNAGYEILGDGFAENNFKDKMIAYDSKTYYDKDGKLEYPKSLKPDDENFKNLSEFWQNIGNTVNSSLSETGVAVKNIMLDKNGVIHYEGDRHVGVAEVSKPDNKVIGNIGQVFEPINEPFKADGSPNPKHGLIETKYNTNNSYIAAGYTGYVVPPVGENAGQPFEERTRLRGYEQMMTDKIKSEIRNDVIGSSTLDNTTGLNKVYHHIYGEKLPLDFEEHMIQEGKDNDLMNSLIKTSQQRIRYDNIYKETSMISKDNALKIEFKAGRGYNLYLDNVQTVMAVMNPETSKNIFDPYATGTNINQGMVRYLVEDAKVDKSGKIIKGNSTKTSLTADANFKYAEFNPPDRFIMSYTNAVNQSSTARGRDVNLNGEKIDKIGVGTAHMSLGGYTQDDAFVVSKEFAEQNQIRGKDGNMRALQIGDKICDHSGNKGVLSFIADRNADMSYYEPKPLHVGMSVIEYNKTVKENDTKAMQKQVIDVFRENPALDVVGAPYTAPSRFNGGTAREMIDSQELAKSANMPTSLKINGKEIEGGMGYAKFIITDMPVDEKTHVYDTDGGRKASNQLVWALSEAGAKDVIDEIYKYNTGPTEKARELCITMGLDISQTGELHKGYKPHIIGIDENGNIQTEQRKEHSVREIFNDCQENGQLHRNRYAEAFNNVMGKDGGFMKMPFPIKLASGEITPEKLDENGKGTGEYMMPVMSGRLRSGRETLDGRLLAHEYTNNYKTMYEQAGAYLKAEKALAEANMLLDNEAIAKQTAEMEKAKSSSQSTYNAISGELSSRYFKGKHNVFKEDVMRKELPNSATAVITPDPTLDVDEVLIPATMAEALGIDKNDPEARVICWRDPMLSAGGTRYPRVTVIENRPDHPDYDARNPMSNLTGIGMNPSSANSYEGDFDGDSVALYNPQSAKAKANAMATLSYEAQLLNRECNERGNHNLYFSDGLDVAAGIYADKQKGGNLKERFEEVRQLANQADSNHDTRVDKKSDNYKALESLNQAMHDAHKSAFGEDVINYKDPKSHFESIIPMTKSGAKGSPKKLTEGYAPYFGAKAEIDENYNLTKFEDLGKPYASDSDRAASLEATHAKAVLTGIAGKFSQHAAMMAKNSDESFSNSAAANALTHPVTQAVLQLKHDTSDAIRQKQEMIMSVAPALWAGQKIQKVEGIGGKPTWEVVMEKNSQTGRNEPVQMSPNEFKKTFMDFYTDKNGLAVPAPNSEHIATMAKIMTVRENGRDVIRGYDGLSNQPVPNEKALDSLANECSFQKACDFAEKRLNLFEGSVNSVIAPKVIRDNIKEQEKANIDPDYVPKFKPIAAKDTQMRVDKVIQPSVDSIHLALTNGVYDFKIEKEQNDVSIQNNAENMSAEELSTTKSNTKSSTTFDANALTPDEKTSMQQSIAKKMVAFEQNMLTPDERAYRQIINTQQKEMGNFKSKDDLDDYISKNPNAFSDFMQYKAEVTNQRNEVKQENKIKREEKLANDALQPKLSSEESIAKFRNKMTEQLKQVQTAPSKNMSIEELAAQYTEMQENAHENEDATMHHYFN